MKEIGDVTFLVVDAGLFLPMARRLAEDAKRVIFYNPDRRSFPSLRQAAIGDGFPDIEITLDLWDEIDEIDCAVFPDIGNAGIQLHLESMGIPVWGSRGGDRIELDREYFLGMLGEIGIDVPEYTVKTGLTELTNHLYDLEDQYIKVSRWRGDMETAHWRNWKLDKGWLDKLAVTLGPLKEYVRFLVLPAIDTPLEIGADTYFVKDDWPSTMISGIEAKDLCYFGSVMEREKMPKEITAILTAIKPFLAEQRYCNQISFEVRVKDDKAFYIDATQRGGMPSSASQQLLWSNFPEIVWAGANGELVDPIPEAKFSIEAMLTSKPEKDTWDVAEIPKSLERWCRFSYCSFVEGCYAFPPEEFHNGELGWLCAIGDTPRQTLDAIKGLADQLPDGITAHIEEMVALINEVESAESEGIKLTEQAMPEPAEVIKA